MCGFFSEFFLVSTFNTPENIGLILDNQQIGPTTQIIKESDFPLQSYKPKVQIPFEVLPGQCPRKIAIERYFHPEFSQSSSGVYFTLFILEMCKITRLYNGFGQHTIKAIIKYNYCYYKLGRRRPIVFASGT